MTRTARCVVWLVAGAAGAGCHALPAGTERHTLEHGGVTRSFLVHIPRDLPAGIPVPVVLVLHGAGGTGRQMERMSGFSTVADRAHFIAVYPDGIHRVWNDGRHGAPSARDAVDDVGFVCACLARVDALRPIDHRRCYATGISNGGFLCHRLANEHAELFAAIAPVASGLTTDVNNAFDPALPVSVYILNGTADPLVPFHGGAIGFARARTDRGRTLGTWQAVDRWRRHDGCADVPDRVAMPDTDPDDRCTVERATWTGGAAGTAVRCDTITGGGHTWPGGPQYLPRLLVGPVCRDFDGAAAIWAFFEAYGRRAGSLTPPRGDH